MKAPWYSDKERYGGMLTLNEVSKSTSGGRVSADNNTARPKVIVLEHRGSTSSKRKLQYDYFYKGEFLLLNEVVKLTGVSTSTISRAARDAAKLDILGYIIEIKERITLRYNLTSDTDSFKGITMAEIIELTGATDCDIRNKAKQGGLLLSRWRVEKC